MPREVLSLAIAIVTAVVIGIVVGAMVAHEQATLNGDIEVVGVDRTQGNVSALMLRVTYDGSEPVTVTPHVWSERQHVQFPWHPTEIRLEPGSQTVRINVSEKRRMIRGRAAQIWLADGQRRLVENFEIPDLG